MLVAIRSSLRAVPASRRGFVSTVLLSKTFEDKTVAELRDELRQRGLATSGNKAALISRLQKESSAPLSSSQEESGLLRSLSTSASSKNPGAQTNSAPAVTPGPSQRTQGSLTSMLDVKIPDLYIPEPLPHAQVPYLPDFWDSSMKPRENREREGALKIVLAAGAETHVAGGPLHNLEQTAGLSPTYEIPPAYTKSLSNPSRHDDQSFFGDIIEDIGIPRDVLSASEPSSVSEPRYSSQQSSGSAPKNLRPISQPLNGEERRGVYILLGMLTGSWLLAVLCTPRRAPEDHA